MTSLAAGLLLLLPGALIYRIPAGRRDERARLAWEERAFWAVVLSVVWALSVTLVLAGFGLYTFNRLLAASAVLSAAIVAIWRGRLRYAGTAPRPTLTALVPVGLIVLGAWLYFPPAEYVIGGRDPGTYVNEGIQIAQRGTIVIHDPAIATVPPPYRDLFFPSHHEPWYYGLRFMGFFIQQPDTGAVVGQWPHLYPASIAIAYGLNGLSGARQAVGVWAILGLVAVYLTGARLFGRTAAAAGTVLLAINVVTVWFAKYPNTELVMQPLLFAALLAFARALSGQRGFFGSLAAALLGSMLFLRYDVVLAFASVTAAAMLAPITRQRLGLAFWIVIAPITALGFWYLSVPMQAYSYYPLAFTRTQVGWGALGALFAAGFGVRWLVGRDRLRPLVERLLPATLAVVLVGLAAYAWFWRQSGNGLAPADAVAFRTFAWYVGAPVLAIGVGAVAAGVVRRFWTDPAFFLTLAAFAVFFFYKTRIVPEHFWAARRYLAITLPGLLLLIAALAETVAGWAWQWSERRRTAGSSARSRAMAAATVITTAVLLAPIGRSFWTAAAPVANHVEYAGVIPRLEQLAGKIGDRELLIVESRNASDLHVLAMPLAYIYARQVLVLDSPAPTKATFEAFLEWAASHYDGVLFLGGGGTDLLTPRIHAEPIGGDRFQVPEYEAVLNAYPTGVRRKEFEYGLYRLSVGTAAERSSLDIPIGVLDDLNVVRFHARERRDDLNLSYRWTTGQSFVVLGQLPPEPRRVTIWMSSGGRPAQAATPVVEAALDDEPIGTAVPVDEVRPYTFDVPADLARRLGGSGAPVRLRLRVPTWNPQTLLGVPDSRDLGVMVTRVQVE